ncbi:hypothetical protein [Spiroplasma endosymbiont of Aspidapion aeneum]|uniref:hypothetical protein n=1 Tax=Spiroplasma endosymbiont of Aspidapion aeneum TaxID=3066276 RepID=UPI00313F3CF2
MGLIISKIDEKLQMKILLFIIKPDKQDILLLSQSEISKAVSQKPYIALIDTGCNKSFIAKHIIDNENIEYNQTFSETKFQTPNGIFIAKNYLLNFIIPSSIKIANVNDTNKNLPPIQYTPVKWLFSVNNHLKDQCIDFVIGMDILKEMSLSIFGGSFSLSW